MFNFFDEIKKSLSQVNNLTNYNLVNISGKILYVEGHIGLTQLSKESIIFRVKGGRVIVDGEDMVLAELSDSTMKITGSIKKLEVI